MTRTPRAFAPRQARGVRGSKQVHRPAKHSGAAVRLQRMHHISFQSLSLIPFASRAWSRPRNPGQLLVPVLHRSRMVRGPSLALRAGAVVDQSLHTLRTVSWLHAASFECTSTCACSWLQGCARHRAHHSRRTHAQFSILQAADCMRKQYTLCVGKHVRNMRVGGARCGCKRPTSLGWQQQQRGGKRSCKAASH